MSKHIPQGFIQQLLDRIDITDLIGQRINLKKKGTIYSACCPFHQEKTPSFSVNAQKQFFYCFGCGKHGNAITFLMDYDHLDFIDCIEELSRRVGLEIPYENTPNSSPTSSENFEQLYSVMEEVCAFFQYQLKHHPEAKQAVDYLKSRGLSGQIAKTFSIGYAPPGWDLLLSHFSKLTPLLLESGLLIKNEQGKIYDRFRHRVIFPIKDRRGRVVGFGGRVLNDDKPKYLNSPETPIFHKSEILYGLYESRKSLSDFEKIILVEGYMDVVALHEHGLNFAMATMGTASSETHLKTIFKLSKKLIISFDGDTAGKQAALRTLNIALPLITGQEEIKFLFLPNDEDPDSFIRKNGKEAFIAQIDQALSLSDYLLQILKSDLNLNTLEGRSQLISHALPYLNKLPDSHYRELLIQQLSALSQLPSIKIKRQIQIQNQILTEQPQKLSKVASSSTVLTSPMEKVLAFLIQNPQEFLNFPEKFLEKLIETSPERKLYNQIIFLLKQYPNLTTGKLFEYFREDPSHENIARLSKIAFDLNTPAIKQEVIDILRKQMQETAELALSFLIEKSKLHTLSPEEKQIVKKLLQKNTH